MALVLANRVQETTTTTGTGTVTLAGAMSGFQSFAVVGNTNTTYYAITSGTAWEVGIGTYSTTGPTLARTTILSSSIGGGAITLAGTSIVFSSYPAEKVISDGYGLLPVANGGTGATTLTSGYLLKGNGTSAVSASVVYDTGTNVGIGTTLPAYPLQVRRAGGAGSLGISIDGVGATDRAVQYFAVQDDAAGSGSGHAFYYRAPSSTTDVLGLMLDEVGNVGIGTALPARTLSVYSTSSIPAQIESSGTDARISIFTSSGSGGQGFVQASSGALLLGSSNTERMRITSTGAVGIGTSSPATTLEVYGGLMGGSENRQTHPNANAAGGFKAQWNFTGGGAETDFYNLFSTATESFRFYQTTGSGTAQLLYSMQPSTHILYTGGTERMRITSSGFVGIGTSSPQVGLHISFADQSTNRLRLQNTGAGGGNFDIIGGLAGASNAGLSFFDVTNSATRMYIDSTGNVGIGAASPAYKLQVQGLGQDTAALTDAGNKGGSLYLQATAVTSGSGGALLFGTTFGNQTPFAAIKALIVDGGGNTTGDLAFSTRNSTADTALTERMRISITGNVGIGTASPSFKLDVIGNSPSTATFVRSRNNDATSASFAGYGCSTGEGVNAEWYSYSSANTFGTKTSHPQLFITNNTERMRINSSGNLLVGTTSSEGPGQICSVSTASGTACVSYRNTAGASSNLAFFINAANSAIIGSITNNSNTGVLYNVTSDARLKENIANADDAASLIDALQVRKFDWKADGSHQRYGFVAQELVTVAPEAVSQPADPDDMMGVDYSKLVPMLVKELQSLRARVAQLEGN